MSDLDELEFNREFPAGVHLRIHPLLHSTELDGGGVRAARREAALRQGAAARSRPSLASPTSTSRRKAPDVLTPAESLGTCSRMFERAFRLSDVRRLAS